MKRDESRGAGALCACLFLLPRRAAIYNLWGFTMNKTYLKAAAVALAAYMAVAAVQRHVIEVPFIGAYLPK